MTTSVAAVAVLALATVPTSIVDAAVSFSAACPYDCEPFGVCGKEGRCECDVGYDGMDCSFPFTLCPDSVTACFNGATCKPTSNRPNPQTGKLDYMCDCSTAYGISFVEGTQCEHPQSEVCEIDAETSKRKMNSEYAFCTNGGKCKKKVKSGENHGGCICDHTNFEGRHCQYEKGTAPFEELNYVYKQDPQASGGNIKKHGGGAASKVVTFFIIIVVGSILGYFTSIMYQNYVANQVLNDHTRVEATLRDLKLTPSTDDMEDDDLSDHYSSPTATAKTSSIDIDDVAVDGDEAIIKGGTLA